MYYVPATNNLAFDSSEDGSASASDFESSSEELGGDTPTIEIADWNSVYQSKLEEWSTHKTIETLTEISNLVTDFMYNAGSYGKIIISEYFLPVEKKLIKPTSMGGIAGLTLLQIVTFKTHSVFV
jgi:hypothetical protein